MKRDRAETIDGYRKASAVIREVARSNADKADACKWRGSSADVELVARWLHDVKGKEMQPRFDKAADFICAEHDAGRQPTTLGVINHVRKEFQD